MFHVYHWLIIDWSADLDELSNSSLMFQLGHQDNSLYLTMLKSLHCYQADKALLSCMQQAQISTDVVEQFLLEAC